MTEKQWHIAAAGWLLIGLLWVILGRSDWAPVELACAVACMVGAEVAKLRQELRDSRSRPVQITVNGQQATYGAMLRAWGNLHEGGRKAPGANQHVSGRAAATGDNEHEGGRK